MKEGIEKGNSHREMHDFRKWVKSLSLSQLQSAIEFIPDDVLKEVVKPPPSTPIHPRGMGYRPWATVIGANDGRTNIAEKRHLSEPRLFQVMKETSNPVKGGKIISSRRGNNKKISWNVISRRFIAPDGKVLGLGCTREQRLADRTIIQGTSIKIASDSDECRCCFGSFSDETDVSATARDLLRMLKVVSRGSFLEREVPTSSLWPPWLNPTQRWFSLAMYIAGRYEVALWSSYRSKISSLHKIPIPSSKETTLSASIMCEIRQRALAQALKRVILPDDKEGIPMVRDSVLFHLLVSGEGCSYATIENCPLLRFQTLMYEKYYSVIQKTVKEEIIQKRQELLLSSLDNETEIDNGIKKETRKRKKRKKGKKTAKSKNISISTSSLDLKNGEVQSDDEDEDHHVRFSVQNNSSAKAPSMEETRKTIMVMSILDNILSAAFDKVGLSEDKEADTSEKEGIRQNSQSIKLSEPNKPEREMKEVDKTEPSHKIDCKEGKGKEAVSPSPTVNGFHDRHESLTTRDKKDDGDDENSVEIESSNSQIRNNYHDNFLQNPFTSTQHASPAIAVAPRPVGLPEGVSTIPYASQGFAGSAPYQPYEKDANLQMNEGQNTHQIHRSSSFETDISLLTPLYLEDGADSSLSTNHVVDYSHFANNKEKSVFEGVFISNQAASSTGASIASSSTNNELDLMYNDAENKILGESCCSSESSQEKAQDIHTSDLEFPSEIGKTKNQNRLNGTEHKLPRTKPEEKGFTLSSSSERTSSPPHSPILVSLSDLKKNQEAACAEDGRETRSCSGLAGSSLPSSPVQGANHLNSSWSRDDFRIDSSNEDQIVEKKTITNNTQRSSDRTLCAPTRPDVLASYRNIALRPLSKKNNVKIERPRARNHVDARHSFSMGAEHLDPGAPNLADNNCARSETGVEALSVHDEGCYRRHHQRSASSRLEGGYQHDIAGPAAETKPSPLLHEPEEIATLREERNTFRDMCLTLGAEVAKLKNLLAAQSGNSHGMQQQEYFYDVPAPTPHNPEFTMMQPFFHGRATTTIGALSDGGFHRGGDHESTIVSEDGTVTYTDHATTSHEVPKPSQASRSTRRHSSGLTATGSDISLERNFGFSQQQSNITRCNDVFGNDIANGLHSRLTKDIAKFLHANDIQLQKEDRRRSKAVNHLSRLVTAVWPRAQVHLYGSHVTGLAIPSSDLDFVICLPAVHKNAPAITPGALEGRNAINESSQKLLAR